MALSLREVVAWGDRLPKTAPDTSTLTIVSERVERGQIFVCSLVNIVDETTINKLLEIGTEKGGEYSPVVKRKAGTNNYSLAPNTKNLIVFEGERLYGKVYSPTSGDKCVLHFNGELCLRK